MRIKDLDMRKIKFLSIIVLFPIIVIAFILFQFKGRSNKTKEEVTEKSQFNSNLPSPQIDSKDKNKLELYMQAKQDSLEREKLLQKPEFPLDKDTSSKISAKASLLAQEEKMNVQLDKIMHEINPDISHKPNRPVYNSASSHDVERLERLLSEVHERPQDTDPEMQQLDKMLDKIIKIQEPGDESKTETDSLPTPVNISTLANAPSAGFFSLEKEQAELTVQKAAIKAIINEEQTVQDGSTIKLRLQQDVFVNQIKIPAGHLIFGICRLANERLIVAVSSIAYNNTIFPIKLNVYDKDGLPGIYIPGAITRNEAKRGIDQSIQTFDPSLQAKMATAGIESLKNLLSKKARSVRATVKSGHEIYLQ